jgi:hypothetical protein
MISSELIVLCLASFGAGFVDSIVGGGGLIQLPAMMMVLPQYPLVTLLGTNKLVSMSGTAISAWRFSRSIPLLMSILIPGMIAAFIFSFLGAYTVTLVSNEVMKPIMMIMLFLVFLTTIRSKTFGITDHNPDIKIPLWKPVIIGCVLGFYDGFFGPGTGSMMIIAFVGILGMTFVQGSAYAKIFNLTTNVAAIGLFAMRGEFLLELAFPMMLFNIGGALLGVKLALLKGNEFVRFLLRAVVFATILKLAVDFFRAEFWVSVLKL